MGGKPKAPTPPDPFKTAEAQSQQNRETAITQARLNNIDQITPFGNVSFEEVGTFPDGTPRFQSTTTLGDAQQGIFDNINRLALQRLGGEAGGLGTAIDTSDPALGAAIADRFQPRLNRQIDERRQSLEARLVNQGFKRGSEAFNRAIQDFGEVETDARNQLEIDARGQALAELLSGRQSNLSDLSFLLTGGQSQQPQFNPTAQTGVQGVDLTGLVQNQFNAQLADFNQRTNSRNSLFGSLANLGSTVAGFALSDKRAKTNIAEVGELKDGTPIYSYKYKDGRGGGLTQLGVMAQEVQKDQPDAVQDFGGYLHVDYDAVTEHALEA